MRHMPRSILPMVMTAIAMLLAPFTATASPSGVKDNAKFFADDTIRRADELIHEIRSLDNRDVLVVTEQGVPADRQEEFKTKSKQKFYADWAEEIALQNGVDGIIILITREPGHLQIGVGNKTRQKSFTIEDRDELTTLMLEKLKAKQHDEALLEGLRFIKGKIKRAAAPGERAQSSAPLPSAPAVNYSVNQPVSGGFPIGGWICAGVGILIVLFVIVNVISRSAGAYGTPPAGGYPPGYSGGYPPAGGYGYGGGGGGFGRGLLGGLLGGALGAWGYDRFFGSGSSTGYPNYTPPPAGGSGYGGSPDQSDSSFSSTGGDFDSSSSDTSSGGGDFGSSDSSSSSDFGDSGGGGDFSTGGDF